MPPVAQGDRGLDAKGPEPGNASYYYSFPRLEGERLIALDGDAFAVTGLAWLDREWSTSSLSPGVVGWDWFALHLSDGRDLMFYRLRTASGEASPFSGGSIVAADGLSHAARGGRRAAHAARLSGRSGRTGVRYPVAWRLEVPGESLASRSRSSRTSTDQEVESVGAVLGGRGAGDGTAGAGPLTAQGYLELAGY